MKIKKLFLIALACATFSFGDIVAAEGTPPIFDGGGADVGLTEVKNELGNSGLIQEESLIQVILAWVRVALTLVGTLAFVAFIWAGFLYITSFANEENAEKAKKILIWTAIGIIVILLAYTFTSALINANFGG